MILVGVMIWNMNHYTSKQIHSPIIDKVEINKELSIKHLSEAITFKDYDIAVADNNKITIKGFYTLFVLKRLFPCCYYNIRIIPC